MTHLLWTVAVVTSLNVRKDPEFEWALSTVCVIVPSDTESPDDKSQDGSIVSSDNGAIWLEHKFSRGTRGPFISWYSDLSIEAQSFRTGTLAPIKFMQCSRFVDFML